MGGVRLHSLLAIVSKGTIGNLLNRILLRLDEVLSVCKYPASHSRNSLKVLKNKNPPAGFFYSLFKRTLPENFGLCDPSRYLDFRKIPFKIKKNK